MIAKRIFCPDNELELRIQNKMPKRQVKAKLREDRHAAIKPNDVTLNFSRLGRPTTNGPIEAFNRKFRPECLSAHHLLTLADAREKLENWRRDDNEVCPHSAIGYKVPVALHPPPAAQLN